MKINKSTILTCIGSIGVIATAAMAVRATPKAMELLAAETFHKGEDLTVSEVIKTSWKCYIPSILVGTSTVVCIFGANALNKKQQAALMSSYAMLANTYDRYRSQTKRLYGDEADRRIIESMVADEQLDICPEDSSQCLFYDPHIGYFESPIEFVKMDDGLECYIIDLPFGIPMVRRDFRKMYYEE